MRGQYSGRLCFRCMENVQLEDSVFITKSAVYHLKCFGCYKCNRVLNDKEEFYGIIDNIIYCQTHYQDLAANYAALFPPPPLLPVETTHTPLAFTQIKIEEDNITADQRKAEWKKLFPSINESTPTGESYSPNMDDRFLQRRWRNPNDNLDFMKRTKVKEELEVDGGRLMSIEGKRVSSRDLNVVNFNTNHSQITSVSHGSAKCAKPYVGGYVKENRQLQTYLNNPLNKHSVEHKGRKAKRDGLPKNKLNPESNLVVAFKKEKCGRRTRTSFKKHQLCVMQHHFFNFGHTPNPTELERLSHKTGLDKRVLQVRFVGNSYTINNKFTETNYLKKPMVKKYDACYSFVYIIFLYYLALHLIALPTYFRFGSKTPEQNGGKESFRSDETIKRTVTAYSARKLFMITQSQII